VSAFRPTVVEIDVSAIRHNVRALKPEGAELMAVVKGNAYGHGEAEVARAALDAGATWLGVALVEEGLGLRESGIDAPVLVLAEFPPGSEKEALAAGLTPSVYTDVGLDRLAEAARAVGRPIGAHVKVDTGMHRVGRDPAGIDSFVRRLVDAGLGFEGLWSHLATADSRFDPFVRIQLGAFREVCDGLAGEGLVPTYRHLANTGAVIINAESHLDLVRVGIGLYGLAPSPDLVPALELRPAMRWRSAVTMTRRIGAGEGVSYGLRYAPVRETTIATVCVGYADGYPRALSESGRVLIRGRRYPVAGTVTMDHTMVDVGDGTVEVGDEVVLIGRQGDEEITAHEVAGWLDTISYEVVARVSPRVPREYREDAG
jgi:alanine racemase